MNRTIPGTATMWLRQAFYHTPDAQDDGTPRAYRILSPAASFYLFTAEHRNRFCRYDPARVNKNDEYQA